MKPVVSLAILIVFALAAGCQLMRPTPLPPLPPVHVEADFFYDDLARFGDWMEIADLGPCWCPRATSVGWRPYTVGRWVYTDGFGWVWAGAQKWSWATEHYGRWTFVDSHGWVWVPGNTWAPAWVAWRSGGGYVGWAALPARKDSDDLDVTQLNANGADPWAFSFVEEKFITDANLRAHIEPVTRNLNLIESTADATRYEQTDRRIMNLGVNVSTLETLADEPPARFQLRDLDGPGPAVVRGQEVGVYRPTVAPIDAEATLAAGKVPPEPDLNLEMMADQRSRLDEYHRELRADLLAREQSELESAPDDQRGQIESRQQLQRKAFEDRRQREVEALRRLQRERRELAAQTGKVSPVDSGGRKIQYDLPPEWQLPPELMPQSMPQPKRAQAARP